MPTALRYCLEILVVLYFISHKSLLRKKWRNFWLKCCESVQKAVTAYAFQLLHMSVSLYAYLGRQHPRCLGTGGRFQRLQVRALSTLSDSHVPTCLCYCTEKQIFMKPMQLYCRKRLFAQFCDGKDSNHCTVPKPIGGIGLDRCLQEYLAVSPHFFSTSSIPLPSCGSPPLVRSSAIWPVSHSLVVHQCSSPCACLVMLPWHPHCGISWWPSVKEQSAKVLVDIVMSTVQTLKRFV